MRRGASRVVLLEGPSGIGKTTLLERFLDDLGEHRVARASGDEWELDVPFGVLDQLLRQAGAAVPPGQLEAGARLLDVLNELQSEGPAVVVVDDAQWADEPSLRALLFAVRRLVADRVLVLLVVRDGEGTRLPEGLRKTAGTRLLLDPLAVGELHELAESVGVAISGRGARRLHEHSGGSPLHARALLAEVPARTWEDADATLPAPGSLAELVAARLCACGEPSVRLLEAAAVLGRSSPLATAARMAEVDDAFAAVEAPAGIDLVALGQGPFGPELHFTHPLISAAVYQGLSPLRRARLHAVAAGLVEDEWAGLNHRVAASAGPDAGLASELEALAERCAGERRWPRACTCLVAAARLSASRADRERRLLAAVEAAMYAGDNPRARALAAETDGFHPTAELNSALAYVAIGDGRHEEAESRLQRAWEACSSDHALAARIAERRAFLAIVRLQGAAAVEWAARSRPARDGLRRHLVGLVRDGRRAGGENDRFLPPARRVLELRLFPQRPGRDHERARGTECGMPAKASRAASTRRRPAAGRPSWRSAALAPRLPRDRPAAGRRRRGVGRALAGAARRRPDRLVTGARALLHGPPRRVARGRG